MSPGCAAPAHQHYRSVTAEDTISDDKTLATLVDPAVLPLDQLLDAHATDLLHRQMYVTWPRLSGVLRSAAPRIGEATIVPALLAWCVGRPFGITTGLLATLAWFYLMLTIRLMRRAPVPGVVWLGVVLFTIRVTLTLASGSFWVYALQPIAGSLGSATAFLGSLAVGRPLSARLAGDFLPGLRVLGNLAPVRRAFIRITGIWILCNLTHAAIAIKLAMHARPADAVAWQTTLGPIVTVTTLAVSVLFLRAGLNASGVWKPRDPAA